MPYSNSSALLVLSFHEHQLLTRRKNIKQKLYIYTYLYPTKLSALFFYFLSKSFPFLRSFAWTTFLGVKTVTGPRKRKATRSKPAMPTIRELLGPFKGCWSATKKSSWCPPLPQFLGMDEMDGESPSHQVLVDGESLRSCCASVKTPRTPGRWGPFDRPMGPTKDGRSGSRKSCLSERPLVCFWF